MGIDSGAINDLVVVGQLRCEGFLAGNAALV